MKNYYYVQVIADNKPKFITSIDHTTKCAKWEKDRPFKQFNTLARAKDIANGLCYNGYYAYVVTSIIPLDNLTNEQLSN